MTDSTEDQNVSHSRRNLLRTFAALGTVAAAPQFANAANYNRGSGDVRMVTLNNARTGEKLNMVYWVDGQYLAEALGQINYFMRDWREGTSTHMDPHTIDIIAATHRMMRTSEPYTLLSGYRSPRTNARLRGAASNSFHMRGMATDLRLKTRSVSDMTKAARKVNAGGVGSYYRSSFVHVDSGPVRNWRG